MAELQVNIVSADRQVWKGTGYRVVAVTTDGELGILPGHVPLLALLAAGHVKVRRHDGDGIDVKVDKGFLSVEHDVVTVVADGVDISETSKPVAASSDI